MYKHIKFLLILSLIPLLYSCETTGKKKVNVKPKEPEQLINSQEIIEKGQKQMEKMVLEGPKPKK